MPGETKRVAGNKQHELRLSLRPSLPAVEAACGRIRKLLSQCRLEPMSFAVEILARECLNNAILHGGKAQTGCRVELAMKVLTRGVRLRVADQGPGFDWKSTRRRRWPRPEETGGRGLMVIETYAQRVVFNRHGNVITLWINRESE